MFEVGAVREGEVSAVFKEVEAVVSGSRSRGDSIDNFGLVGRGSRVDSAGKSEGGEVGDGTEEVGVSLKNYLFFDSNFFSPRKIAVFNYFQLVSVRGERKGVVGGGNQAVVQVNGGRVGIRGSRKETSADQKLLVAELGTVAADNEGEKNSG